MRYISKGSTKRPLKANPNTRDYTNKEFDLERYSSNGPDVSQQLL